MKKLLPKSLAGRTLIILFLGLTLSHIVSILVFTSEKMESAVQTSESQLLERMATFTRLLCDTPESVHQPILTAMNQNGIPIDLLYNPETNHILENENSDALRQKLEQVINRADVRVLNVHIQEPDWHHNYGTLHRWLFWIEINIIRAMHSEVIDQEWHALIQLPTQQKILLTNRPAGNHVPLFRHATISVLIMSAAILLFALLMMRHMTRPWQEIIQAAERLGRDIYAAPLPEQGTTEIIHGARIFNRMHRRIREFVEERLQIIAAISHDLRTPLTQLRLLAEFILDESDRTRMLSILDEMEKMFTTTLAFARDSTSTEPKQLLNLSSLLATICSDLTDAGHQVLFTDEEKRPYFCRPVTMKRALINLIDNAIQYGNQAEIRIHTRAEQLTIEIEDAGPGIPPTEWENVMRPFRRLEPSRNHHTGGTGMGLSIANSVILDHGGTLRFTHPNSGGFIVQVILPIYKLPDKPATH